jgi:hypothetical protein
VTWGCAGDPVCDVPWIVFTQNAIDLLNHFHQTIPILFELDLLAKAFQTFIIATRHGSPRDFSSRRGRNTKVRISESVFKGRSEFEVETAAFFLNPSSTSFNETCLKCSFRRFSSSSHRSWTNLTGLA